MTPREAALRYAQNGWPIVPLHNPQGSGCSCGQSGCKVGKHPRISGWEKASLDTTDVEVIWTKHPDSNIGLRLDGLIVLDVDGAEGLESLAALEAEQGTLDARARQRSGSGGWHYLFSAVPGIEKRIKFRLGLDLLTGPGCYIVCAPSLHASGGRYEWVEQSSPLTDSREQIALLPPLGWLLDATSPHKAKSKLVAMPARNGAERTPLQRILEAGLEKVCGGEGRNDAGLWLFCQMRDAGYSRDEASLHLKEWVARANEAAPGQDKYTMREASATLRSAYSRDARDPWGKKDGEKSHTDILLDLITDFEYFHSGPANDAYVRMIVDKHLETWKVDSRSPRVREILTHRFLLQEKRAPSREALNVVLDTIIAKCGLGPKIEVYVRFARSSERIYIDLCDNEWRAIEVSSQGWRISLNPPVRFKAITGTCNRRVP